MLQMANNLIRPYVRIYVYWQKNKLLWVTMSWLWRLSKWPSTLNIGSNVPIRLASTGSPTFQILMQNSLATGEVQRPHRHNSVALDLAIHAAPGTYTLMGTELTSDGWVKDPIRYVNSRILSSAQNSSLFCWNLHTVALLSIVTASIVTLPILCNFLLLSKTLSGQSCQSRQCLK